jgi:hypoxanthine phosphoribosyltransferase
MSLAPGSIDGLLLPAGYGPLFDEAAIAARIDAMAEALASRMVGDWTVVALLQGAMPFTVDLMRALARRGVHPILDSLWLESYRDARESSGRVVVRADLCRPLAGRSVLILDDVFDTGRTIAFARAYLSAKGSVETIAAAFIRKPPALSQQIEFFGFDAPDKFLLGYGMDDAGLYRGLPIVAVLDEAGG